MNCLAIPNRQWQNIKDNRRSYLRLIVVANHRSTSSQGHFKSAQHPAVTSSYYALLGVHPSASVIEIRRAYRKLSKSYHPDTTVLPQQTATVKFQQLNEAYATLSHPERRSVYDLTIGYSRYNVIQPNTHFNQPTATKRYKPSSAYLDPTDRPLSSGELFALFSMGISLILCLLLAIAMGLTRTDFVLEPILPPALIFNIKSFTLFISLVN
ncbi:MAG: J domain-containing protein [Microcoleaceae cyanobacterium]